MIEIEEEEILIVRPSYITIGNFTNMGNQGFYGNFIYNAYLISYGRLSDNKSIKLTKVSYKSTKVSYKSFPLHVYIVYMLRVMFICHVKVKTFLQSEHGPLLFP